MRQPSVGECVWWLLHWRRPPSQGGGRHEYCQECIRRCHNGYNAGSSCKALLPPDLVRLVGKRLEETAEHLSNAKQQGCEPLQWIGEVMHHGMHHHELVNAQWLQTQ